MVPLFRFFIAASCFITGFIRAEQVELQILKEFSAIVSSDGKNPTGALVPDGHGYLWGITSEGGENNCGTVFKLDPKTLVHTKVIDFESNGEMNKGKAPADSLAPDGEGYLWGTTRSGGAVNCGTVFKIDPLSGILTTVHEFERNGSSNPNSSLTRDNDGNLWGTTTYGGLGGTIFRVDIATGILTTVVYMGIEMSSLAPVYPEGGLVADGSGNLWGVSSSGGQFDKGTIYKMALASEKVTVMHSFAGQGADMKGTSPGTGLTSDGAGNFWGCTSGQGKSNGTIFKINVTTGVVTTVKDLIVLIGPGSTYTDEGDYPSAKLVPDGKGNLWGMTAFGGRFDSGTIFKINLASEAFVTKFQLGNETLGDLGRGGLYFSPEGELFGTSGSSGQDRFGTIFRLRLSDAPSMSVERPSGIALGRYPEESFGGLERGAMKVRTFTIRNSGKADLVLGPIVQTWHGRGSFSVSQPARSTLPPDTSTTFQVTFSPGEEAEYYDTARFSLSSNDPFAFPSEIAVIADILPAAQRNLSVSNPNGSVQRFPDKLIYHNGEEVRLLAVPAAGYVFTGWSGDITSDENPLTLQMTSDMNVIARFKSYFKGENFEAGEFQWRNTGASPWTGDPAAAHVGTGSNRSGAIGHGQKSGISTLTETSGTITFWWKVSSEAGADWLEFRISGELQPGRISGEAGWEKRSYRVGAYSNLEWTYSKNALTSKGSDAGWVDGISWIPDDPYEGWKSQVFEGEEQSDPLISGPMADPDQDGSVNIMECFRGSRPLNAEWNENPRIEMVSISGRPHLVYTYVEALNPEGVIGVVEYAADLAGPWKSVVRGKDGITISFGLEGASHRATKVTMPLADQRRFIRLRVTSP